MVRSFKIVCLGGGNSAGYLAKELVAGGLQPGELCIITEEPVSERSIVCNQTYISISQ
jgi:monodehydroascorbate reductase (NADH)